MQPARGCEYYHVNCYFMFSSDLSFLILVPKNKRSVKLKKTSKMDGENKAALQRQNSISCCSEDESINVPKSRASRGSATDSQSLYARVFNCVNRLLLLVFSII